MVAGEGDGIGLGGGGVGDDRGGGGGGRDGGDGGVVVVVFLGRHGEGLGLGGVDGLAPELEVPVGEGARVLVDDGVFDDDGPGADAGLAPGKG